jgi:hypothetical protein
MNNYIKVIHDFGTSYVNKNVIADVHPDRKSITTTIVWDNSSYIYHEVENMDDILEQLDIVTKRSFQPL